jgi:hypothetical protein
MPAVAVSDGNALSQFQNADISSFSCPKYHIEPNTVSYTT